MNRTGTAPIRPGLQTGPIVLLLLSILIPSCGRESPRPPDILLVTLDTTRADRLGCYGYAAARTPVLDRLASDGVRVERALTVQPMTLPSHASILTGTLPPVHGIRDNGHRPLPQSAVTLAESLRDGGYQSAAFVAAIVLASEFGLDQGFDHYQDEFEARAGAAHMAERRAGEVNDQVIRWVDQHADPDRPLFLWVHYYDPHAPYQAPEAFRSGEGDGYDDEVAYVDAELGRLLASLDQQRGDERYTLVTADHGEALADHKEASHGFFIYDSTMRVPWIMSGPELAAGRVVDGVWQVTDVAPTLLDLAGVAAPSGIQGQSLKEHCLAGATPAAAEAGRPIWTETYNAHFRYGWSWALGYEKEGWKLIDLPRPELYHVSEDPAELQDLATDPVNAGRMDLYRRELERWNQQLDALQFDHDAEPEPSTRSRAMLEQLGYLAGKHVVDRSERGPDLKEMLPHVKAFHRCRSRIAAASRIADPERALELLDRTLERLRKVRGHAIRGRLVDDELANGLIEKGRVLTRMNRHGQRRLIAEEVVRLLTVDPDEALGAASRLDLALALEWLDRQSEALAQLRATVKESPWSARAWLRLGELLERQGQPEEARDCYRRGRDAAIGESSREFRAATDALRRLRG